MFKPFDPIFLFETKDSRHNYDKKEEKHWAFKMLMF